jgi:hypothetical protein
VETSRVLASFDYSAPITLDIFKMLMKNKEGINWE